MNANKTSHFVLAAIVVLSPFLTTACNKTNDTTAAASDSGKVPITTKSDEARKEYLAGRDLSEKLQGTDSWEHFQKAVALDPDFATAELALANNAPTAKEFFEHLNKALALQDKASDGEKLVILAAQAGSNGQAAEQKAYLEQLVAKYPNDERAQFNLGNYYFGQQELGAAVEHYKKATELAPNFSQTYNQLGYAYRQQGDYANSEQAFKKYVELIPSDPNPYDSYAELLLKTGRFDESITQYRKALAIDPHFIPSHFGISADLMYLGKPDEAAAELQKIADVARNDGELRTAYFGMAVAAADQGKFDKAVQAMDKEFAVAEKKHDLASMAADLQAKGNILAEARKYDEAQKQFDQSLKYIESSDLTKEVKNNAALLHHFNLAAIAMAKNDLAGAKPHIDEYRKGVEALNNPAQLKQAHELAGRLALAQKDYDTAISELQQANQQDPRNLYRLAQAYQGKGDKVKAHDLSAQAATFNPLPALPYAFIRAKAQKMADATKG